MFSRCQKCTTGALEIRSGWAAEPPDPDAEHIPFDDEHSIVDLHVVACYILHCTSCDFAEAGYGIDADGNTVSAYGTHVIRQFLTSPDMIIVDDEVMRRAMDEQG